MATARELGPQAERVYSSIRARIQDGTLPPRTRMPSQPALAREFGVALMTVRHAMARLEQQGLIVCEHGRGTYVRPPEQPLVLIVDEDGRRRLMLSLHFRGTGYRCLEARNVREAEAHVRQPRTLALVLCAVHLPTVRAGLALLGAIRQSWPDVPVVALTDHADDICLVQDAVPTVPVMVLSPSLQAAQIEQVLGALGTTLPQYSALAAVGAQG